MSHAYHQDLPGYAPGQILVDGCPECEKRAADPLEAMLHLDEDRQLLAWRLMRALRWSGGEGVDRPVSQCERKLVGALYLVGVWLQRGGIEPDEVQRRFEIRLLEVKQSLGMADEVALSRLLALRIMDRQADAERVAQALADAQGFDWQHLPESTPPDGDHDRQMFRVQAFAALGAMAR